jgi:hypothetical protein
LLLLLLLLLQFGCTLLLLLQFGCTLLLPLLLQLFVCTMLIWKTGHPTHSEWLAAVVCSSVPVASGKTHSTRVGIM